MSWLINSKKNLIPLSKSNDFNIALKEWVYTGNIEDVGEDSEMCELCEHPNIRYKFEIQNELNGNILMVGSECITKFYITSKDVFGEKLTAEQTAKKVSSDKIKFISDMKKNHVINKLIELGSYVSDLDIKSFLEYYSENEAFTPKQLSLIIWKLENNKIQYKKTYFKMKIKRNREKEQLLSLKDFQIKQIWDCMSESQKKFFRYNKY